MMMPGTRKRLVVMLSWLGATPSALSNYERLYPTNEYDIFTFYPTLKDFLWPESGLSSALATLQEIETTIEKGHHSSIVIHAFSIGCYYYSLMLYQARTHACKFERFRTMISAQVMDSPVVGSTSEMAFGVAKMTSRRPAFIMALKNLCLVYFSLTRSHTVHYYDIMIEEFTTKSPTVPSLCLASTGDPMLVLQAFHELCDYWKSNRPLKFRIWEKSSHVEHLRFHPKEYRMLLSKVLSDYSDFSTNLTANSYSVKSKL